MVQQMPAANIFQHIKPLVVPIDLKTHRLRVGEYRIFIRRNGAILEFQNIDIRKNAYRK